MQSRVEDIYPVSPMQGGMLFHTLKDPGSGVYVEQMSVGLMDVVPAVLRRVCEEVLRRHAVLRSSFHSRRDGGEAVQVVEREVKLPWEEHDWRGIGEGEQEERLRNYLAEDR